MWQCPMNKSAVFKESTRGNKSPPCYHKNTHTCPKYACSCRTGWARILLLLVRVLVRSCYFCQMGPPFQNHGGWGSFQDIVGPGGIFMVSLVDSWNFWLCTWNLFFVVFTRSPCGPFVCLGPSGSRIGIFEKKVKVFYLFQAGLPDRGISGPQYQNYAQSSKSYHIHWGPGTMGDCHS